MIIKNELERQITSARIDGFDRAIRDFDPSPDAHPGVDPRLIPVLLDGMRGQRDTLVAELAEFDALEEWEGREAVLAALYPVFRLGEQLVRARVAVGMTQAELAAELGVANEQIERDEANGYALTSLTRLQEIAEILRFALGDTGVVPSVGPILAPEPTSTSEPVPEDPVVEPARRRRGDSPRVLIRAPEDPGEIVTRGRGRTRR